MQDWISMCFKGKTSSPLKKEHRCQSWEHRILEGWSSVEWGEEVRLALVQIFSPSPCSYLTMKSQTVYRRKCLVHVLGVGFRNGRDKGRILKAVMGVGWGRCYQSFPLSHAQATFSIKFRLPLYLGGICSFMQPANIYGTSAICGKSVC